MVPHARRIGTPVYRRPYPENFDQEEFPKGFKFRILHYFSEMGSNQPLNTSTDSQPKLRPELASYGASLPRPILFTGAVSLDGRLGEDKPKAKDSTKPSGPRTTAVHAVDIEDIDSEERGDKVYLEEEEESARNAVQDLIDWKILKFPEKATMGVDQNPFPNAQVNMVNGNFPMPDQRRPRLDWVGSAKAATERRAREIPADPKAKGKAKMYPEVTKVLETKVSTKEEPLKAIVLCSRCQCEVTLEVVPPKPNEPTKEPTKG
ncbi:hypothetical protein L3X38_042029 [Prunus dulcis]|uniref:Uncharacterized protein n=1 Tax=Prunus dulcis TaxID=3755 RepID=A0AAD4UTT0_PRUDU|nr:hypothetical protein L3X38_042029 [Prunus dulcis]